MTSGLSFGRILRRSLLHRRARSVSALISLTVSAAVATALLTLYADLDSKLHKEFRGFGANILLTSPTISTDTLSRAQQAAGADALLAPFAYVVATTDRGTPVVVAGTDFGAARRLDGWWQVAAWPTGGRDALIGQKASNFVADERALNLQFAGKSFTVRGVGRLRTGGDEDSRIYMPLPAFTEWTGVGASVIELQVPGGADRVEAAISNLRNGLPGVRVEPVRQLVEGESRVVDRTHALMYAAVLLIALTVAVSVLATLSASVLERRRDFALMKALGSTQVHLFVLFMTESLALAMAGVGIGYVVGSGVAWAIGEANFHTATMPRLFVVAPVLVLNGAIAAMAAFFPAQLLRRLEPAALLRGE